jgi:metal-responsive CopG/Arc/MetJ family transcriptional regulator
MADTVRVSLVFPRDLWEEVKRIIPAGERSRVIAEATEREIRRRRRLESIERLRVLQEELRQKYGEMPSSVEDIRRMREERDAQLTGLR